MSNQIVLDVVVDTSKATQDVKTFGRTAETELGKVERKATPALKKTETGARDLGKSLKGTEPAISAMGQSLTLMGNKGAGAITGLGSAFASFAAAGTGPLGLAIAGVAGLVAVWADFMSETEDTASRVKGVSAALKEQNRIIEEQNRLVATRTKRVEDFNKRAFDVTGQSSQFSRNESETRLSGLIALREQARDTQRRALVTGDTRSLGIAQSRDRDLSREINALRRFLEADRREIDRTGGSGNTRRPSVSRRRPPNRFMGVGVPDPQLGGETPVPVVIQQPLVGLGQSQLTRRSPFDPNAPFPDATPRMTRQIAENDARIQAQLEADFRNRPGRSIFGQDVEAFSQNNLERDAASRAESFGSAVTSAIDAALQTNDWSGAARSMAGAFVSQMNQALIGGLVEGLGVKKAAAGLFESAGSATLGSPGGAPTP